MSKLIKLPKRHYVVYSKIDVNNIVKAEGREDLTDVLADMLKIGSYHVWFKQRSLIFASDEAVRNIERVREEHIAAEVSVNTKTEWRRIQSTERRKMLKIRRAINEVQQYKINQYVANDLTKDVVLKELEETGVDVSEVTDEQFETYQKRFIGRTNANYIHDCPSIPTGLISVAALELSRKERCEDHFLARQRSGENTFLLVKEGKSFSTVMDSLKVYRQTHFITSRENTLLVKEQNNPNIDHEDWKTMYRNVGIVLLRIVEEKNGYVILVWYNGETMSVTEALRRFNSDPLDDLV